MIVKTANNTLAVIANIINSFDFACFRHYFFYAIYKRSESPPIIGKNGIFNYPRLFKIYFFHIFLLSFIKLLKCLSLKWTSSASGETLFMLANEIISFMP